ncbi:hypothetical protein GQ85_24360 [Rhodococcus rhodochrous]|nr:hypothetical protein GQ85_24360 [Rhodococcus rhodochrous]
MKKTDNIAAGVTPTIMLQSTEVTPDMAARARRTVAANAHGVDDARMLLEMLGLVEPRRPEPEPAPAPEPEQEATPEPEVESAVEWIETDDGPFRKCAGTCGSPVRQKWDPPAPGVKVINGLGMCGGCYDRSRRLAASQS